jgi:hypothetical protein
MFKLFTQAGDFTGFFITFSKAHALEKKGEYFVFAFL